MGREGMLKHLTELQKTYPKGKLSEKEVLPFLEGPQTETTKKI
jgi:hypothetical protein